MKLLLALAPIVLFTALAATHVASQWVAVVGVAAVLGFIWLADTVRPS